MTPTPIRVELNGRSVATRTGISVQHPVAFLLIRKVLGAVGGLAPLRLCRAVPAARRPSGTRYFTPRAPGPAGDGG